MRGTCGPEPSLQFLREGPVGQGEQAWVWLVRIMWALGSTDMPRCLGPDPRAIRAGGQWPGVSWQTLREAFGVGSGLVVLPPPGMSQPWKEWSP